mmetsp:Transcript_12439/g.30044  ORF Transcript_12439/g.30044 Transcript_12439/m.30044 type:complete len:210 (+) Transcript_12439:253-882(+)
MVRLPPCFIVPTPSITPLQMGPCGRPNVKISCRPTLRVSRTTAPVLSTVATTLAASRYPGRGCSPPPVRESVYRSPDGVVTSTSAAPATSSVPSAASRTSRRVLSCSVTTPKVRMPSHARPPAMPKRRVRKLEMASVLSALRAPPPFLTLRAAAASAARAASAGLITRAAASAAVGSSGEGGAPPPPSLSFTANRATDRRPVAACCCCW